jgi:hypothetical protein
MAAAGGFQHGLQHDCHEALTFILSIAHEEETKLLKQRRREANIHISDKSHEFQGVVARNFGIMERVVLTVRKTFLYALGIEPSCAFVPVFPTFSAVSVSHMSQRALKVRTRVHYLSALRGRILCPSHKCRNRVFCEFRRGSC